ncbi:MAG: peroxiredoxin [Euryarchaeota archaeon]|nr:peroxiredoxin [Euryarchaeota archaeon]
MLPQEGKKAPSFTAKDETGKTHRLSDYKGKAVVLYFYPTDDTPGCTKEACSFRDQMGPLEKSGATVLGVSRQNAVSHQKFKEKYGLNFPLLVDEGPLSESYGTWVEKNMYGRKYMGMQRSTFLIAPDQTIAKVWEKVKPEGHAAEVVSALKAWGATAKVR